MPSNSSRVLPLVSGMKSRTKINAAAAMRPYPRKVPAVPKCDNSQGKINVTLALIAEFQKPATDIAMPRHWLGKISDNSTHITGQGKINVTLALIAEFQKPAT